MANFKKIRRKLNWLYIRGHFSRQYIYDYVSDDDGPENDPGGTVSGAAAIRKDMDPKIEAERTEIRKWISRGLGGGLLSSLTVAGSQTITGSLKSPVFWLIVFFLVGLAAMMFRKMLVVWKMEETKNGQLERLYDEGEGYLPARAYDPAARILDICSLAFLCVGMGFGIYVLFQLTTSIPITSP